MKGWIRLGVVLSGFWIAGVLIFAIAEFLSILPGECIKAEKGGASPSVELFFFSCSIFSDLMPNSWGHHLISWGNQLIEFNTRRFIFILFGPVFFSWPVTITVAKAWRWVTRGFKE